MRFDVGVVYDCTAPAPVLILRDRSIQHPWNFNIFDTSRGRVEWLNFELSTVYVRMICTLSIYLYVVCP